MKKRIIAAAWIMAAAVWYTYAGYAVTISDSVFGTRHNLSSSGPLADSSINETRVCVFCHTPHRSITTTKSGYKTALWNHTLSNATYTLYRTGGTIKANIQQPDGSSSLCLSCHDGTIAVNDLANPTTSLGNPSMGSTNELLYGRIRPGRRTNLSTDLRDDHPVSFIYDDQLAAENQLLQPNQLPAQIKLENGKVQCSTCHDAHRNPYGKFVVTDYKANPGALCATCHRLPYWNSADHNPDNESNPALQNSCRECHDVHGPNASDPNDFLLNVTGRELKIPVPVGPYKREYYLLCYDCHEQAGKDKIGERGIVGVGPDYVGENLYPNPPGYPLLTSSGVIKTKFRNVSPEGYMGPFGQGNLPVNIHWEHLHTHNYNSTVYDSDHDGTLDSGITCVSCHDPHGSNYRAMTNDELRIRTGEDAFGKYGQNTSSDFNSPPGIYCASCHGSGQEKYYYQVGGGGGGGGGGG